VQSIGFVEEDGQNRRPRKINPVAPSSSSKLLKFTLYDSILTPTEHFTYFREQPRISPNNEL